MSEGRAICWSGGGRGPVSRALFGVVVGGWGWEREVDGEVSWRIVIGRSWLLGSGLGEEGELFGWVEALDLGHWRFGRFGGI